MTSLPMRKTSTVSEYIIRVKEACPPKSIATYHAGFARVERHLGDLPVDAVTAVDLRRVRDATHREVGRRCVERALATGRPLRSYDADAHGHGAAENFVRAASFFFRSAMDDQLIAINPMRDVRAPRRPRGPERSLAAFELEDLLDCARSGPDPELDLALLHFLRQTAARREGALNLTLGALAVPGRAVLSQKFGTVHEVPLDPTLGAALVSLATSRGAQVHGDRVFRRRSGHPISRRHFSDFFDRLDTTTTWSRPLDVGAHWLRHTTLTDVANAAGAHVAAAYAGHRPGRFGTIGAYLDVEFADLEAAHERVFGRVA